MKMASMLTPKSQGEKGGQGKSVKPDGSIIAALDTPLANGDGLGYFDPTGRFTGFRVNRVEGSRIFPATRVSPRSGTVLYRNSDMEFERESSRAATRTLLVDMALRTVGSDGIALNLTDARGINISTAIYGVGHDMARTPQTDSSNAFWQSSAAPYTKPGKSTIPLYRRYIHTGIGTDLT